ncbi:sugar kinase [Streptomyces ruber]|uniref:Sugar kinase n=2 Tax=Streptomyces TaxID=1883 RepID=A0A918BIJ5_9ACTN|nr:ROK family transcriptional regulator [Streptomyces ruber]GGQ68575.1 sugar kinase [Streptomyces ruber]
MSPNARIPEGAPHPTGPGAVLDLIRSGRATTRAELMAATGLSRSTMATRLEALTEAGYVEEAGTGGATGGRRAQSFRLRRDGGVLLVADIGGAHVRTAVTDLAGRVLDGRERTDDVGLGPAPVLDRVADDFRDLLAAAGHTADRVRGIGIGVPGPVEAETGRIVSPPIMTGWDGYRVPDYFAGRYDCPVLTDNDTNLMALGEYRTAHAGEEHLVFIKLGTGIGAGLVLGRRLHRGAGGAAGDIGHSPAPGVDENAPDALVCRCGLTGCLEAYASGWALVRDLRELGHRVDTTAGVVSLIRDGHPDAVRLVRQSGRLIGRALADTVSLLNPSSLVIGGELAYAGDHLLAGVREITYRRSLPLATRELTVTTSRLRSRAGTVGAAGAVTDVLYAPATVDAALSRNP